MSIVRSLVTAALVFTLGAATFAQSTTSDPTTNQTTTPTTGRQHGGHGGGKWKKMLGQLNLTSDQKSQIKQIMKSGAKGKERRQQIIAILTPDQKAQLKSLRSADGGRRNHGSSTNTSPSATSAPATTTTP